VLGAALDPHLCYKALQTRDERFDGRIFVAVTTTGIYCRPVCPARPAKIENCRFYPSAAAAQQAGFRPCLRCRPETAPDLGSWRGTSNTVSRGLALIAEGELDGEGASIEALAERLGVGERHLRRLFQQHVGASPIAVAQTRRVLFAKQLIHETDLPMAEVALAAGFGSLRRFNETFQQLFERPPSALRVGGLRPPKSPLTVRLRYRTPYDWPAMLGYLSARAIDGVERVEDGRYVRTVKQDGEVGEVEIAHMPKHESIAATIRFPSVRALAAIVARIRRVFDLGTDITMIGAHLARDPLLAPLVAKRPGLRTPGAWDGFELGVRAILGQQVTVEAGRQLASKLVRLCQARTFPSAAEVGAADLRTLGMPNARKQALVALASAAKEDPHLFEARGSLEKTVARLTLIPGIGDWTAHYIALRAAREPDAFPSTDVGLVRASGMSAPVLLAHAERWRPWRAYAAQHIWTGDPS
jgi:AraC family transcriptional regulator of adaptative response / DNA-3-methyladenine glycosylase II